MKKDKILNAFKNNKPIILWDPRKEKEADFVFPGETITKEIINFMLKKGRGLLCIAAKEEDLVERGFFALPTNEKDMFHTNYFITIDYKDTKTGITAKERAKTISALSEGLPISQFIYPGHVHLLGSKGIENRRGHTEGSVELMELLSLKPYAVIIEILDDEGDSHNFNYIKKLSEDYGLPLVNMQEIYREVIKKKIFIHPISEAYLPTEFGNFKIVGFKNFLDGKEHFAIYKGNLKNQPIPLRIHSECVTGDALSSLKCDCGSQLRLAMKRISEYGKGILLYLRQEGRDIGITNKIQAYHLQDEGIDTVDANKMIGLPPDNRDYAPAIQMLKALGVSDVILLTNNPDKERQLRYYGINVVRTESLLGEITPENFFYLKTKVLKMKHKIPIKGGD